jgi:hypothetical protein
VRLLLSLLEEKFEEEFLADDHYHKEHAEANGYKALELITIASLSQNKDSCYHQNYHDHLVSIFPPHRLQRILPFGGAFILLV